VNAAGTIISVNEKPAKLHPLCPASTPATKHSYSLKTLVTVHFAEEKDTKTDESVRICPACKKGLNNSSKAVLANPCGHVVCGSCVDKFIKPPDVPHAHHPGAKENHGKVLCYVCDADLAEPKKKSVKEKGGKDKVRPGLVEISSEGTGFAGGGVNMTKRDGITFQC
jgi:nitric oxide synthase-interacting protein